MKRVELLNQVKALPPGERRRFLAAVRTLEKQDVAPTSASARPKRVTWPDVEARARRIFGSRVLPNLVLIDRQDELT
jgi:hypothetical protein